MGSEAVVSPNKNGLMESSLVDIEEAYLELIRAYSACLAYIIIEKRYLLHFMVPLIIMRRLRKRVNTLRATFLFIMAAEKKEEASSNSTQKFKQYSEDLNTLREHIIKSESSYLFAHSTPAIVSLLLIFLRYTIGLQTGKYFELAVRFIELILFFVLFVILVEIILTILLLVPSLMESRKIFNRFGITEKEKQFFKLSQNYFWMISGFKEDT
jgi:hypothetical protein